MNRRILTLLVVFLLLFTITLSSCGETVTTVLETTTETPTDSTTTPTNDDPTANVPTVETAETLGIMTFNLRYDVSSHACMKLNVRGPHLMEIIDKYNPDSP